MVSIPGQRKTAIMCLKQYVNMYSKSFESNPNIWQYFHFLLSPSFVWSWFTGMVNAVRKFQGLAILIRNNIFYICTVTMSLNSLPSSLPHSMHNAVDI